MPPPDPMICDRCGTVMNHHADKPDPAGGGTTVEEVYACPGCGALASRPRRLAPA